MEGDEHFMLGEGIEGVGGVVHEGQSLMSCGWEMLQSLFSPSYHQPIPVGHLWYDR